MDRSWSSGFEHWVLFASIAVSVLAFGSVELWSLALMELLVTAGVITFLARCAIGRVACYSVPGILPLMLFMAYMAFQAMPLPPHLLKALSPTAFEIYSSTVYPHSPGEWMPVALHGRGLLIEFFRFASYAGIYVLSVELMSRRRVLKRMIYALAVFVSLLALLSIIEGYTSGSEIMWLRDSPGFGTHYGPFVNKNHYAGFMGMALPVVIGAFLVSRPRDRGENIRLKFLSFFSGNGFNWHLIFAMGAVCVMISIVLSLSRSGVAAMLVSVSVLAALLLRDKRTGKGWIALLALSLILSFAWFEASPMIERFQVVMDTEGPVLGARKVIFSDSMRGAMDFIVTGGGFGSFEHIYPSYRTLEGTLLVDHAHNDYAEFIMEGGLISTALALWFLVSVAVYVIREVSGRRNRNSVYICYSSIAGIIYMLLHSFTDFNLHVGSNGLFFFLILGMAVSASSSSTKGTKHIRLYPYSRKQRYAALCIAVPLCCASLWFNARMLLASDAYNDYQRTVAMNANYSGTPEARGMLERAVALDVLNPVYRLKLAAEEADAFEFIKAEQNISEALVRSPLCGLCLQTMASLMDISGEEDKAGRYLAASTRYGPRWTDKYLRHASWLSAAGHHDEALRVFVKGIESEPMRAEEYINSMFRSGFSFDRINENIPPIHEAMLALAQKAVSSGLTKEPSSLLDDAFPLMRSSDRVSSSDFNKAYWMNISLKRYSHAYAVASEGVERFNKNSNMRTLFAIELERLGYNDKALDAYRYALDLNPANATALRGARRLDK